MTFFLLALRDLPGVLVKLEPELRVEACEGDSSWSDMLCELIGPSARSLNAGSDSMTKTTDPLGLVPRFLPLSLSDGMSVPYTKTLGVTGGHRAGAWSKRRYEGRSIGSGAGDERRMTEGKGECVP